MMLNRVFLDILNQPDFEVEGGDNAMLYLTDGRAILDFWGDNGVASLGYGADVNAIIRSALSYDVHRVPQMFATPKRSKAAEALTKAVGMDQVFFANSGTESVEAAIKLARLYQYKRLGHHGQNGIATIVHNYHGATGFSMAANDDSQYPHRKAPFYGPNSQGIFADGFAVMDENFELVDAREGADPHLWVENIGAVILAPIQADYEDIRYRTPEWHRQLRDWCTARNVILIHDDVQAGAGRCGAMASWLRPEVGVKPDILTLGKGMAAGFPMSATFATAAVGSAMEPGRHFCTTAGSNLGCAMALEVLYRLTSGALMYRANVIGELIRDRLKAMDGIAKVHGIGMMIGFTPDYGALGVDASTLASYFQQEGLFIAAFRSHGMMRFMPPLTVTDSELAHAYEAMEHSFARARSNKAAF